MTDIPSAFNPIQQESVSFNNPVSESSLNAIGATVNGLLSVVLPVGCVIESMLTEAQFQTEIGNTTAPFLWVLADGRNVLGSTYNIVTGNTTIPDLRGLFTRGKNNGRSDGNQNPDGDLALGALQANQFGTHNHSFSDPGHAHTTTYSGTGLVPKLRSAAYGSGSAVSATDATGSNAIVTDVSSTGIGFVANGGNETRPTCVTVNVFIRIN